MDRLETHSPFSTHRKYTIAWGKEKEQRKFHLNENQEQMIRDLVILKCATKIQIARILNPGNMRHGKQTVQTLVDYNILVSHELQEENSDKTVPFYTLSSNIAEQQGVKGLREMKKNEILLGLLMSQFYIRFKEVDHTSKLLPFPLPFQAALTILGSDFRVAIVRGSAQPIIKHFMYHQENMKTFVIVEKIQDAEDLKQIKAPIRITTDYHMLRSELSHSFYRLSNNSWQKEYVGIFQREAVKTAE